MLNSLSLHWMRACICPWRAGTKTTVMTVVGIIGKHLQPETQIKNKIRKSISVFKAKLGKIIASWKTKMIKLLAGGVARLSAIINWSLALSRPRSSNWKRTGTAKIPTAVFQTIYIMGNCSWISLPRNMWPTESTFTKISGTNLAWLSLKITTSLCIIILWLSGIARTRIKAPTTRVCVWWIKG